MDIRAVQRDIEAHDGDGERRRGEWGPNSTHIRTSLPHSLFINGASVVAIPTKQKIRAAYDNVDSRKKQSVRGARVRGSTPLGQPRSPCPSGLRGVHIPTDVTLIPSITIQKPPNPLDVSVITDRVVTHREP